MPEFPLGEIGEVRTDARDGWSIQEISLTINQRHVFLRAGEVYENTDGSLTVCDRDESVLVFLNADTYSGLTFNEPIYRPHFV